MTAQATLNFLTLSSHKDGTGLFVTNVRIDNYNYITKKSLIFHDWVT